MHRQFSLPPFRRRLPVFASFLLVLAYGTVTLPLAGCGSATPLASGWSAAPIAIDGSAKDWGSTLTVLPGTTMSVGARNDATDLYLCFVTQERTFRSQMMVPGLAMTIVNAAGGSLGILYPVGIERLGGISDAQEAPGMRDGEPAGERRRDRLNSEALRDIEVIEHGAADGRRYSTYDVPGIAVKTAMEDGLVVCEMRIPLRKGDKRPFAIDAAPGSALDITLKSAPMENARPRREETEDGESGDGMRPQGGMRPDGDTQPDGGMRPGDMGGGYRGGRRGGMRAQPPEALDVTLHVQLAAPVQ